MCLQEHWLWSFEARDAILDKLPNWECTARSVDDHNNISQINCPRGHGGVAVLWKKDLQPFIQTLNEGNERILPITVSIPNTYPLCLISCYLPSGERKSAIDTYMEDLAVIGEIVSKYRDSHNILIGGDLNADIFNRDGKKEKALREMIKLHRLENLNHNIRAKKTYKHHGASQESHLDYFLCDDSPQWENTRIIDNEHEMGVYNSSTHCPILCKRKHISVSDKGKMFRKKHPQPAPKRIDWSTIDLVEYQTLLDQETAMIDFSLLDTNQSVTLLTSILDSAAERLQPKKSVKKKRPKRNRHWNPDIQEAMKAAKAAFWRWKEMGRPGHSHPCSKRMLKAKKKLRAVQRQASAEHRTKFINDVMKASEDDQKTFHRLIKRNRGHDNTTPVLHSGNGLTSDPDSQRDLWATYFEKLSSGWGSNTHTNDCTIENLRLHHYKISTSTVIQQLTSHDVREAIKKLNKNKAADMDNITAEHLLNASPVFLQALTTTLNSIIKEGKCPDPCKSGYKIPIPKKGKDIKILSNYRGITITAIIGKVLEHLLQNSQKIALGNEASNLQFGFSEGLSPIMATLCLTEALAVGKAGKTPVYAAALDAQKAFDVVNHNILKEKLHLAGIHGSYWLLFDDLYSNVTESVKWQGELSRNFYTLQGVRQGAVTSTGLYKLYINQLLRQLESADLGLSIGTIYIGTPTCADDQLLLASTQTDLQAMISHCHGYSKIHGYNLHPEKSTVTRIINTGNQQPTWSLGDNNMPETDHFNHLGLVWKEGCITPNIPDRIQVARRTSYALMGTGVHGKNGLSPVVSLKIINTYVIPRLLYGLEATVLSKKQLEDLERFHKGLLRKIQGLPGNVASEATYYMLGTIPIEAQLHIRALSLFGAICMAAQNNTTLQRLICRQLSIDNKYSWFQLILKLSQKYNLNIEGLAFSPWRKKTWKEYVKSCVESYWQPNPSITKEKTSLHFLDMGLIDLHHAHPVWESCTNDARLVPAAMTRATLLVGSYLTQRRKEKLGLTQSAICQLCQEEEETMEHMLLTCKETHVPRTRNLQRVYKLYNQTDISLRGLLNGPDRTHPNYMSIQRAINDFCHQMHIQRLQKLGVRCSRSSRR